MVCGLSAYLLLSSRSGLRVSGLGVSRLRIRVCDSRLGGQKGNP